LFVTLGSQDKDFITYGNILATQTMNAEKKSPSGILCVYIKDKLSYNSNKLATTNISVQKKKGR